MISHQEIKNLVAEWGLREDIIEKDYVIGWLLWGISAEPELNVDCSLGDYDKRRGVPSGRKSLGPKEDNG
jgi:hypothetical protein